MDSINDIRYGVYNSRRLLIKTITALEPFKNAVTVIGAHAVHVWIAQAWGAIDMQATRDADVVINPVFVSEDPKIVEILKSIGVSQALKDRPGIYGFDYERDLEWSAHFCRTGCSLVSVLTNYQYLRFELEVTSGQNSANIKNL